MHQDDIRLICSLATWRSLRQGKKTQFDVLDAFCGNIIAEHYSTTHFEIRDIADKMVEAYGLKVPDAIIKYLLDNNFKDYLHRTKDGKYGTSKNIAKSQSIIETMGNYDHQCKLFEKDFQEFLKKNKKNKNISQDFMQILSNYLLRDEANKEDVIYLCQFLHKNEAQYKDLLQIIKEGVILYEGLNYRIETKKTKEKIMLFLDTEILFHALGYNGDSYKQNFDDFYKLVCRYDSSHLLMPLYYTEMVKEEISSMFEFARKVKEKNNADYKPTSVMSYLMTNCKDKTDIDSEETRFFHRLEKEFHIKLYNESYDDLLGEFSQYNIESKEALDTIKQEYSRKFENANKDIDKEVDEALKALNYINMIRRCNPKDLFKSKALLLTDTGIINRIAWNKEVMDEKTIPLSNPLNFFIQRLWEFLEVSLGEIIKLKSNNPIFNLQIAFKKILYEDISKQYERAKADFKKNRDKELYSKEIVDIHDKLELDLDKDFGIEQFECLLTDDDLKEQRKFYDMEKEQIRKKAIEEGKKLGAEQAKKDIAKNKFSNRIKVKIKRCIKKIKYLCKWLYRLIIDKKKDIIVGVIVAILGYLVSVIYDFISPR